MSESGQQHHWPDRLHRLLADLRLALAFLTRLPASREVPAPGRLAEAAYAFPIAGLAVGALAGLAYLLAWELGLYPLLAAVLAVAVQVWLTRGLHEDGLADLADGLAGASPEARLAIMRDSRIGSFGALALGLALALRVTAVAEIADPGLVLATLAAAGAASRALMAVVLCALPPARTDGLGLAAGRPRRDVATSALAIAALSGLLLLPWQAILAGSLAAAVAAAAVGGLARRRLGGQTGDVLGAAQQAGEIAFLLAGAVLLA
jgi:adenosylcobinamide-GDP ribazoletransferase